MVDLPRTAFSLPGGLLAAAVTLLSNGCAPGADRADLLVTDSVGITVADNRSPQLEYGSIDQPPEVLLGTSESQGQTEFFRIRGAKFIGDSLIAVTDGGSNELRIFNNRGHHVRTHGGTGAGPGEFRYIEAPLVGESDTILVFDAQLGRMNVFDASSGYVESFRLDERVPPVAVPIAVSGVGELLGIRVTPMSELGGDGVVADTAAVLRFGRRGELADSLAEFMHNVRSIRTAGERVSVHAVPLSAEGLIAGGSDGFCLSESTQWEITCLDWGGAVRRIVRLSLPLRPITSETKNALIEHQARDVPPENRARLRRNLMESAWPDHMPAIGGLILDEFGAMWASDYKPPFEEIVLMRKFAPDGSYNGYVELPANFSPTDVKADRILGIFRDALGVEYVVVYRMRRL